LLKRYITIANTDSVAFDQPDFGTDNRLEVIATESAASRMTLLRESVRMTLTHPFFGAGPGMFPVAAAERATALGIHTAWLETHNSYTQISSECGLPALFFYMVALLTSIFRTTSIYMQFRNGNEPRSAEIAAMAFAIRASLIAFAVTAFFASVAYLSLFPCLAGLSAAFNLVVKRDFEPSRLPQPAQAPTQVPNRQPLPVRGAPLRRPAPAVIGSPRNWKN
jgi:O-antigen ligase